MRKYLLAQLENKTMTPFPQQTKRVKRGKEITHRFPLYCKCRVPFFEDDPKEDKGVLFSLRRVVLQGEKKGAIWKCLNCKEKRKHAKLNVSFEL